VKKGGRQKKEPTGGTLKKSTRVVEDSSHVKADAGSRDYLKRAPETKLPLTAAVHSFTHPPERSSLLITTNFPPFPPGRPPFRGGITEEQYETREELRQLGVKCNVISLSLYGSSPPADGVFRIGTYVPYQISGARRLLFSYLELFRPMFFFRSLSLMRRLKPQVVEVGETRQLSLSPLFAALVLRIPVVMRNDWLCPAYPREHACTGRERILGCGECIAHGAPAPMRWLIGFGSLSLFLVKRCVWNRCTAVTAQSAYQAELFRGWGIHPEILIDVPTASLIGESEELTRELREWGRGCKVLLFVGRLTQEKGFGLLLDAFNLVQKKRKDVLLLVAGEGPQRREQDGVRYLGWVEKSQLGSAYRAADIFVIPTTVPEAHPAVVEDAFNYGLPVVATPVGALREMVGGRGVLSMDLSSISIADAVITALLKHSGKRGER